LGFQIQIYFQLFYVTRILGLFDGIPSWWYKSLNGESCSPWNGADRARTHVILSSTSGRKASHRTHAPASMSCWPISLYAGANARSSPWSARRGCGKTTLLKLIGGLDTPLRRRDCPGAVRGATRPSSAWTQTGGQTAAGITQDRHGRLQGRPRTASPGGRYRQNIIDLVLPGDSDPAAVQDLLETLDLWPFRNAFPAQLRLAWHARVAIARAFAIAPEIVLLDEPFVSLDSAMAERSRGGAAGRLEPATDPRRCW